jgi:hypothetical protein
MKNSISRFILLFSVAACSLSLKEGVSKEEPNSSSDKIRIRISLGSTELDVFGLPVDFQQREDLFYCIVDKEVVNEDFGPQHQIRLERKGNLIVFAYQQGEKTIDGSFLIPDFEEVYYQMGYDAETMLVGKLSPYRAFNLIRYGVWTFKEKDSQRKRDYACEIVPIRDSKCD